MGAKGKRHSISRSLWRRNKQEKARRVEVALEMEGVKPAVEGLGASETNEVESLRVAFERPGVVFGGPEKPAEAPRQPAMDRENLRPNKENRAPLPVPYSSFPGGGGGGLHRHSLDISRPYHVDHHVPWFPTSGQHSLTQKGTPFSQRISRLEHLSPHNSYSPSEDPTNTPLRSCHLLPPFSPYLSTPRSYHRVISTDHAHPYSSNKMQEVSTLSHQSNAPDMSSDISLTFYSCSGAFATISHSVHRIIASKNQRLSSLFHQLEHRQSAQIYILAGRAFTYPSAFVSALLHFYEQPLISQDQLFFHIPLCVSQPVQHQLNKDVVASATSISRMNFVLCFATAGVFFMESQIVEHALSLLSGVLSWETLDTALSFGTCPISFELTVIDQDTQDNSLGNDSIDSKGSDGSTASCEASQDTTTLTALARKVLNISLRFVVDRIPIGFKFERPKCSSTSSLHPAADPTNMSLLFVSLPFNQLRKVFKYMRFQGKLTEELVAEVIQEREAHRMQMLRKLAEKGRLPNQLDSEHEVLGWEEQALFKAGQPLGAIIGRGWTGSEIRAALLASSRSRRSKSF
ncbi:hypothetical protein H112_08083 [Trichophyton rubrum D6]|uniref:Uncharacterized protein n=3 Tax=Trichophyton rubrum TaxID=5551 RepID=A0A178ETK2_TRIRU|nr:uncharacterized protein TERG_00658 [Trichophyton rubrum CBS 118892]EZF10632.1 hypothetical protein H100_08111 [Trichophyton rubrum MR850]EZF37557.1 hypothetical protein H102_08067 [Trichophyton rubrum CBS 100081]EZF48164.1 hypothetical protein H103_08094 [Trichophyton rubrum CBS 288.86]EZF58827.1 hypothetical protein H104_08041 [Trichophyton rubrum CBS 289.86]EZF80072.1 hypothetical protein H110_08095 [Trichophyton rubrum MR1448]EZF90750.1 hypothetical protein H113_08157 [Trichophyton rubr